MPQELTEEKAVVLKKCSKCSEDKSLEEFHKNKSKKNGHSTICKICTNSKQPFYRSNQQAKERMKIHRKKWADKNPGLKASTRNAWRRDKKRALEVHRKYKYGISSSSINWYLKKQNNSCALCFKIFVNNYFHVDHCHKTKIVRGLLCSGCNVGIGLLKDDPEILLRASKYVVEAILI